MRILIIHTYYQLRGGEDAVFEQEASLMSEAHEVRRLKFYNRSGLNGLIQFFLSVWNFFSAAKLRKAIGEFKPDVIHIHNLHFAAGPILIRTARKMKVPVVLTLHNYRLVCPSGTLLHNGELLTSNINASFPWDAVKKSVYRNSKLQTFWLAFIIWFHRRIGTWKQVDRYLVLTAFARDIFINSSLGIPADRFYVKPNFVKRRPVSPETKRQEAFLFIGRLSVEKGISVLLETFRETDLRLLIAGDGPEYNKVIAATEANSNIRYLGRLSAEQVSDEMSRCSALIFPSVWYEGMPMTILEAFASGTAVIASDLGAMSAMVKSGITGLKFHPGSAESMLTQLCRWMSLSESEKEIYRNNALKEYENNYTPEGNLLKLTNVYQFDASKATE